MVLFPPNYPLYGQICNNIYYITNISENRIIWGETIPSTNLVQKEKPMYKAKLLNPNHDVHDGDTLVNVHIKLLDHPPDDGDAVEVWPNIVVRDGAIYAVESIRLYGIDTAEIHPHHTDVHGNVRTPESLNMEKELAQKQRIALYRLLEKNNFEFWVKEPENGKFAGRVVAKVIVNHEDKLIDAGEYLIQYAGAHPYFGHTKKSWE